MKTGLELQYKDARIWQLENKTHQWIHSPEQLTTNFDAWHTKKEILQKKHHSLTVLSEVLSQKNTSAVAEEKQNEKWKFKKVNTEGYSFN